MKLFVSVFLFLIINAEPVLAQSTSKFVLDWRSKKDWKQMANQKNEGGYLIEFLKNKETFDNWKELIAIQKITAPGVKQLPLEMLMKSGFESFKKNAPEATLTFIAKDEEAKYPWIEYISEAPRFNNDPNSESQFFHIVKSDDALFIVWWAVKKAKISMEEIKRFKTFFGSGKIE